jgi:hypothetical protein
MKSWEIPEGKTRENLFDGCVSTVDPVWVLN